MFWKYSVTIVLLGGVRYSQTNIKKKNRHLTIECCLWPVLWLKITRTLMVDAF